MMVVLKGTHPFEGEITQDFTYGERETAVQVGQVWAARGWRPRLMVKSYRGEFVWLTSLLYGQKQAA